VESSLKKKKKKYDDSEKRGEIIFFCSRSCTGIYANQVRHKAKAMRFSTLEAICKALNCQPGDILEFVPDEE
jgi:phosphopantetheinyl transferase (holo-ACP synthase)